MQWRRLLYYNTCAHDDAIALHIYYIHVYIPTRRRGDGGRGCGAWPLIGLGHNNVFNGPPANGSVPSPFFPPFYGVRMYIRAEHLDIYVQKTTPGEPPNDMYTACVRMYIVGTILVRIYLCVCVCVYRYEHIYVFVYVATSKGV